MTRFRSPPIDARILIRKAGFRDIRAVHRLEQEIFAFDAYPYFDLFFLFLTPGIIALKAVNEAGALVGIFFGVRSWLPFKPAWIVTLGVASDYQRQGIGSYLLVTGEEHLGSSQIRLTVRQSNAPAIELYKQHGYTQVGVRARYYHNGEDGLVMEKMRG